MKWLLGAFLCGQDRRLAGKGQPHLGRLPAESVQTFMQGLITVQGIVFARSRIHVKLHGTACECEQINEERDWQSARFAGFSPKENNFSATSDIR